MSIQVKLFFSLCVVIVLTILFLIIINNLVLETFYIYNKKDSAKDLYEQINEKYNNNVAEEEIEEFISGTKTDRVKEIAKALQELNFETYIDKFDMSAFSQNDIYPDIWGYEDEADLIKDDLRNSFENLKKFYEKMAAQESAVLVSIY